MKRTTLAAAAVAVAALPLATPSPADAAAVSRLYNGGSKSFSVACYDGDNTSLLAYRETESCPTGQSWWRVPNGYKTQNTTQPGGTYWCDTFGGGSTGWHHVSSTNGAFAIRLVSDSHADCAKRAQAVVSKPKPTPISIPVGGAGTPIPGSPWTPLKAQRDPNLYSYSNFIVTGDFAVIYYCSHKDTAPIHSAIPGQNSRKDCEDGNFIELSVGSEDHIRCTHASNGSTFRADGVAGTLKRVDFPSYAGRFYCKNVFSG